MRYLGSLNDSHTAQTAASRAFDACHEYSAGLRGRPRFKRRGEFASIGGKHSASPLQWKNDHMAWGCKRRNRRMVLRAIFDKKDRQAVQAHALSGKIKGEWKLFVQRACEGDPLQRFEMRAQETFRRIGGDREIKVSVRIISATHRDLPKMVAEHTFREDLYYRLNVLNLEVPALRERPDDILLLARHFIERACAQAQKPSCRLNAAASAALLSNRWPGNVRQLQNVVFRAVTMTDQRIIDASDLGLAEGSILMEETKYRDAEDWATSVAGFERTLLQRLYPQFPSSRKLAPRLKTSHSMDANKLRKYGIPKGQ